MMLRWFRRRSILAVVLTLVCVAPVLADDEPPPYSDVPLKAREKEWLQWVAGVLFIGACVGVAMKNPARSHLD